MDSEEWTIYNGLLPAIKYNPAAQEMHFNAAALELLQLKIKLDLNPFVELITPSLWQQLLHLQQGQSKLIAWPIAAPQPSRWLLWTAAHTPLAKAPLFFQITDQTSLGRAMNHWQHQAQLATIGQAMAGICHEVNQPLNAMRMRIYGLQAMHQGAGIDHIDEHLAALDSQVGRCADTLSNMREMVGHQSLNLARFNVAKSIERIIQLLKHPFSLQQVKLCNTQISADMAAKFWVFGQAQRLEQVLINLVNNARDALEDEAHRKAPASINLSLNIEPNEGIEGVTIKVTDNGPGIPLALQEKVFEAYYTSKSAQQGTGLGLALCRDLMHDLGGNLTLASKPGKTTFSLWMPTAAIAVPAFPP